MIWSIKMICSSSFSGYYQYLLVFTYRTSSRCSSKKLVASTHCLYIDKYCFCPSLWSWITIQGSLIFGSNTAVSDVVWILSCYLLIWYFEHLSSHEIGGISYNSAALFVRSIKILIFISANNNWFTLYKCGLCCAWLPDVWS